jgi:hypothetical protein
VQALTAKRDEISDKIDELDIKRMNGEITPEEFAKQSRPLKNELDDVKDERAAGIRQEKLRSRDWDKSIKATVKAGKVAGIDYTNPEAATQFDAAWRSIAASSKVPLTPKELHAQAHATVLAVRGIKTASTSSKVAVETDPKKIIPPARKATKAPTTLRGLPSAAISNTGGDGKTALARLPGDQFEKAWSKLTPAQKAALTNTDD